MKTYPYQLTDDEWRAKLDPEAYRVLRQAGTERPFVGKYTDTKTPGIYYCAGCDAELFRGTAKFHSGCGWPSFYEAVSAGTVEEITDYSHGMIRTEVVCANCGSHLGHVFGDAPHTPTGLRYCINSVCLRFEADA